MTNDEPKVTVVTDDHAVASEIVKSVLAGDNKDVMTVNNGDDVNLTDEELTEGNAQIDAALKGMEASIEGFPDLGIQPSGSAGGRHRARFTKPTINHKKRNKLERKRKQKLRAKRRR